MTINSNSFEFVHIAINSNCFSNMIREIEIFEEFGSIENLEVEFDN